MSRIIADIYEIQNKIGAGGGGIVYLGRHLRLDKQIVLKADKRKLSTATETLRREVDLLKGLNQTYIPQVYDFVQENGTVYTVMDYIEGESLDKLLGRGQIPKQPQVIKWACQLLEALDYLHHHQPHGILHGDIKPANIMLRPSGDICLIDYNIALALGEEGAVKVGFSRGYASPEHYGADYIRKNETAEVKRLASVKSGRGDKISSKTIVDNEVTIDDTNVTLFSDRDTRSNNQKGEILLDVRSDIYCLGATLYHLLSGCKPEQDARKVVPLGTEVCSEAISSIISKAMNPQPDMRYQTAQEMLTAFRQLTKYDKRVIRHKRRMISSAVILSVMFLTGGASAFVGLKQMEQHQNALVLSEYSADALEKGDVEAAVGLALQAIPDGKSILEAPVSAQAQKALTDALGVYDLSDGFKAQGTVALPSAPFDIAISQKGSYLAAIYAYEMTVYDMETGEGVVTLPTQQSALSDVVFVDNSTIVYAGDKGVTAYDLNTQKTLWTGETATNLAISGDKTVVAAVNRDEEYGLIYRVSDGGKIAECNFNGRHIATAANDIFADPKDYIFALNEDGSMLAVSFNNGGLTLFQLDSPTESMVVYEDSEYRHMEGGFSGKYFAFAANKSDKSLFRLIDTEQAADLGGYESQDNFLLQADTNGIYLANGNMLVSFQPDTLEEKELAYTGSVNITGFSVGEGYSLLTTDDNQFSFYDRAVQRISSDGSDMTWDFTALTDNYAVLANRNEPVLRILKLESHREFSLLSYDADYIHDEARMSHDGKTAMLFQYQGFRIYDRNGEVLTEVELPDAENIYDQQFRKNEEESWLEVIWYDGTIRCYSAYDGAVLSERVEEAPKTDLYEEFYIGQYRIASPLHEAPMVYEMESGKLVAVLEEDSYLTYVTQAGDYIITEYVNAEGERYGILLDKNFQTLAYLPGLCDIMDGMLVFDYKSGNLRHCRLYSLQELLTLGEKYSY